MGQREHGYPKLAKTCLDEAGFVWFMLHSGSRGVGNFIGTTFIELAKQDAMRHQANLPDRDLAYFEEGSRHFGDYVRAVGWGLAATSCAARATPSHSRAAATERAA